MVNLSKLTKAELQSTGFKNTSTARNFLKDILKTKAQKFNKEGLINKLTSEFNKFKKFGIDLNEANKTANKAQLTIKKAENAIKKGKQDLKDIKNKDKEKAGKKINKFIKNSKKFKELHNKQWHIAGLIKITKIYNHLDTRGKTYTYEIEEKDGGIYKGTKDEAIEEFKKEMFIKYNRIDPSPEIEYIVKEIIINSILQIENNMTPIEDTPMKQATQLDYNIIDEYKDFLQNNGTCVIDNFIGMYGEALGITRDNFIDMCKEYYKQYNINWTVEDGISPKCVSSICQKFDIAHYAFDVKKNCFIKHISRNSNYKALVYFAVNNHMYLILDSAVRKSLIERKK